MSTRLYPRQTWILMPSFRPSEITIVKPAHPNSSMFREWDTSDKGKDYHVDSLHPSKEVAIAAGREQVKKLEADIAKRQETLRKRVAALDKADKGGAV